MLELSDFPAPTAGVAGSIVLLLAGHPFGTLAFSLSLAGWLVGQYITGQIEAE